MSSMPVPSYLNSSQFNLNSNLTARDLVLRLLMITLLTFNLVIWALTLYMMNKDIAATALITHNSQAYVMVSLPSSNIYGNDAVREY